MANLAVADLCLLCALPFFLHSLKRKSPTDTLLCQLSQGVYLVNRYMSISLVMAIALDRYVAVLGRQEGGFCFSNSSRQSSYTTIFSLLGFYLPLAVLVFCSLQVVAALAPKPAADTGQVESTQKAARMVWANLVVFVVCFLPFHVVLTVQVATGLRSCALHLALDVTSKLSNANCCLDAVCYYYMAKEFQEASALAVPPSAKAHKSQESLCVTLA
ncbi:G-protein coupled receptor 35-like protein [Camelus ferus]|nr:G-protein coupled receptor 35-like protein [Camelus ferus]